MGHDYSPENRENLLLLEKSEEIWKSRKITAYNAEINYIRAAFPPEIIILIVRDGRPVEWKLENIHKNYSREFIDTLTIESMFSKMRQSLESYKPSPMTLSAEYAETGGYIKVLSRSPSRDAAESGRAPFDTGYRIEIVNLEIIEKE